MKHLIPFLLLAVAVQANAQVKMSVEMSGKPVGTAAITQQLKADGSKSVDLRMEITGAGRKMTIRSQNSYDKDGLPLRKFMESIVPGGKMQKQIVATFDKSGANLVILDGEKRETKKAELVETAPRKNLSEFWFLRDKPKVGDKVEGYVLNMDTMAWELQTVVYQGMQTITVGGKSIKAHAVETTGARKAMAYLDDKGLPWLIEAGSMTMKRISESS